jgi:glutamyl-Q tRNA(Asp) synthetase
MATPFIGNPAAQPYRGRFAPTPSGPLHLGSLLTALASFLDARHNRGVWLLRIDDLDVQRVSSASETRILKQLEAHGLTWDEAPRRQSGHIAEYLSAIDALRSRGFVYACECSRAHLGQHSLPGPDGAVYNGECRSKQLGEAGHALRLHVPDESLLFADRGQGLQSRHLARDLGDFVLRRRDGIVGYQLACAVDEHAQRITNIVRGADLLGSTFMQIHLMQCLRLHVPDYRHLPVLTGPDERKLSKQNRAPAIDEASAPLNLLHCLQLLGQNPSPALKRSSVNSILQWAIEHWNADSVPKSMLLTLRTL